MSTKDFFSEPVSDDKDFQNDEDFADMQSFDLFEDNSILTIYKVMPEDMANYSCLATDSSGNKDVKFTYLTVLCEQILVYSRATLLHFAAKCPHISCIANDRLRLVWHELVQVFRQNPCIVYSVFFLQCRLD